MNKQKKRLGSMSLCKVVLICLFLSVFSTAWAAVEQTSSKITVTGVVKDVQGEPLIGATIKIKGSAVGTVSDFDGNYSLANVPVNGVLEFSYVGMNSIEISVSGKKVVNAVLSDATQLLDQVVVIGYGSVKKSDLTGSVATVKPEALSDIPANSVEGLLQGRAAGVQVINSSQDPGAGSTVRIRGNSSLRGSNSPLIVVDGFPLGDAGDLKQINTDDIVSMEVLKDASASAIYGSRGANGVIIVTTRRAKEGTTTVSVKQQLTFSEFSSTFCPGTGFCGGTGEVPGLLFPAKITVICDIIIGIFGTTGGVMEAALRSVYEIYTGRTLENVNFEQVRGLAGVRRATIDLDGFELKVGIAHGLGNARHLLEDIRHGRNEYHVIEIMACPGGCIGGGGQPLHHGNSEVLYARANALYREDAQKPLRKSHENPYIKTLYEEYLGRPLSETAERLLHTHYFNKAID